MNERIRELAEQAVVAVDLVTGNEALDDELAKMYIPDCFSEKFAELIVRECAKAADEGLAQVTMKVEWPSYHIKKHFGVEE